MTKTSSPAHQGRQLAPCGVLGIDCPVAVGIPGLAPPRDELGRDMRIGKIHRYGEVIELLQYPLHAESTDTGGRLYLNEASHIWSQNASVVEHLTHRTRLLSACRTPL